MLSVTLKFYCCVLVAFGIKNLSPGLIFLIIFVNEDNLMNPV